MLAHHPEPPTRFVGLKNRSPHESSVATRPAAMIANTEGHACSTHTDTHRQTDTETETETETQTQTHTHTRRHVPSPHHPYKGNKRTLGGL